jgi:tetratricopeptide (TPR) repeat protein
MYEGDIVPAIRYFRKCLKHDDSFITAYQYLMRIYYAFGKIASARRIIRVALVFYPDYIDAELDLMALRCLIGEERGISAVTAYLNKHRDREDALNKRIERLKQDVEIITRKNAQKKSLKRARF